MCVTVAQTAVGQALPENAERPVSDTVVNQLQNQLRNSLHVLTMCAQNVQEVWPAVDVLVAPMSVSRAGGLVMVL